MEVAGTTGLDMRTNTNRRMILHITCSGASPRPPVHLRDAFVMDKRAS